MEKVIIKENYNDKIVKPNKGLEKALKELDYMIKHSDEYKSYSTIEELFKFKISKTTIFTKIIS